jgi:hypothetical protein
MAQEKDDRDESTIRKEITEAMIMAGVMAYVDWKDRRRRDPDLSRADLATAIYVAMRRRQQKDK